MKLTNTFIFKGEYMAVKSLHEDFNEFKTNKRQSQIYTIQESKHISDLVIGDLTLDDTNNYKFGIHFKYKKNNLTNLINYFESSSVQTIYLCESSKANIWIVSTRDDILKYELIPHFAAVEIIADYIDYTEHSIITDHYNTIKLEGNKLIYNDQPMTKREVRNFLSHATIKGKPAIALMEQFILEFYTQCTNSFDELDDQTSHNLNNPEERTSLMSMIIVSISIFLIIFIISYIMGIL